MSKVNVTDRAVVRYLERVYGVNVKAIKKRIASTTLEARKQGARSAISDGVRYSLAPNGKVISVGGITKMMTNRGERWRRRRK